VSGETPAFKHSRRLFSIAQSNLSLSDEQQNILLANNSRSYTNFYYDFMQIDLSLSVSAQNIASAEFVSYSLLYIFDYNASHSFGYVLQSTTLYSDGDLYVGFSEHDTELFNASRSINHTVASVGFGLADLVLHIHAVGNLSTSYFTQADITYFKSDFEVSKNFIDSITDLDSPIDYLLYGLMLPLILLSTDVVLIQLLGVAFLLGYIAMIYWLGRTILEEIF